MTLCLIPSEVTWVYWKSKNILQMISTFPKMTGFLEVTTSHFTTSHFTTCHITACHLPSHHTVKQTFFILVLRRRNPLGVVPDSPSNSSSDSTSVS